MYLQCTLRVTAACSSHNGTENLFGRSEECECVYGNVCLDIDKKMSIFLIDNDLLSFHLLNTDVMNPYFSGILVNLLVFNFITQ